MTYQQAFDLVMAMAEENLAPQKHKHARDKQESAIMLVRQRWQKLTHLADNQ